MSGESVLEMIRKLRNDRIKDFLDERYLIAYFQGTHRWLTVTTDNITEVKKALREMLTSPVDVSHYASLLDEIRLNSSASIIGKNEELFRKDVERVVLAHIS